MQDQLNVNQILLLQPAEQNHALFFGGKIASPKSFFMKKNMAVGDRFIRFVLAVVLVILFFTKDISSPLNYLLLAVAIVFGLTAVTGRCPLYSLFHIDTRQFKY